MRERYVVLRYRRCGRGRRLRVEGVWPYPSWWAEFADTPAGHDAAEEHQAGQVARLRAAGERVQGWDLTPLGPLTKDETRDHIYRGAS